MPYPSAGPKRRLSEVRARRVAVPLLAAVLLAGCASSSDTTAHFLVAPGKYVLYSCADIAQQAKLNSDRQRELEGLMMKAGTSSAGQLVSATTYRPEYLQLRGEMDDLRQSAANKKCKFVPGVAGSAPPAGPGALHQPKLRR